MEVPWRLIRDLTKKRKREKSGLTVAEGPSVVLSALEAQVEISMVVFTNDFLETDKGKEIQRALGTYRYPVKTFTVSRSLYVRMSEAKTPQGVLCVVPIPFRFMNKEPESFWKEELVVVGMDIQDPGNVGTLIRTANALGVTEVLFCGETADPLSPKCIRASAGSIFNTKVSYHKNPVEQVKRLLAAGIKIFKTTPREGIFPWEADFRVPCAVLLGNEGSGLRQEILSLEGQNVSIPMPGGTESLNVATACSMILYEALRQRFRNKFL